MVKSDSVFNFDSPFPAFFWPKSGFIIIIKLQSAQKVVFSKYLRLKRANSQGQ